MVRTVISLEDSDKKWLDRAARREHTTMTQVVRKAVRRLREEESRAAVPGLAEVLAKTRGTWRKGDALRWQRRLRSEWGRRG